MSQERNEKICLIGYGYWGKIIHRNLTELGYDEVKIVDETLGNYDEITEDFDCYFVVTPFSTHMELILSLMVRFRGKKIWCEKPLVETLSQARVLYMAAKSSDNKLFVDWTYTFNPCVKHIREILRDREVKQIVLNRTNDGPARQDCDSIHDLASHDLSILYHLLGTESTLNFNWNEFSLTEEGNVGSNISWCYYDGLQIIINSSWQHTYKNRVSLFVTSDDETLLFDDIKKTVTFGNEIMDFSESNSPLQRCLLHFLSSKDFEHNEKITLRVTESLQGKK